MTLLKNTKKKLSQLRKGHARLVESLAEKRYTLRGYTGSA